MADQDSLEALHQQLDTLWIRYLDMLDQYTQAQQNIKKSLGQGFLSLAQANFTSSGRRYGQDYYDQRAVASSRVHIMENGNELSLKIATIEIEAKPEKVKTSHLPTPEPEDKDEDQHEDEDESKPKKHKTQLPTPEPEESADKEQKRPPSDPLRQFGILIPSALRSAQKSFTKAVRDDDSLKQAMNSARRMRELEVEIRKARKVLKKAERDGASAVGA